MRRIVMTSILIGSLLTAGCAAQSADPSASLSPPPVQTDPAQPVVNPPQPEPPAPQAGDAQRRAGAAPLGLVRWLA